MNTYTDIALCKLDMSDSGGRFDVMTGLGDVTPSGRWEMQHYRGEGNR
jgi:hypothetical protein